MTRVLLCIKRLLFLESVSSKKATRVQVLTRTRPALKPALTMPLYENLISFILIPKFSNFKIDMVGLRNSVVGLSPTWLTPGYATSYQCIKKFRSWLMLRKV
jgi:hypothetical protein